MAASLHSFHLFCRKQERAPAQEEDRHYIFHYSASGRVFTLVMISKSVHIDGVKHLTDYATAFFLGDQT